MEQDLPIAAKSLPELENKCLGYLFMKLEGVPVQAEQSGSFNPEQKAAGSEQIKLYLTLQFNEQRELLSQGYIKFGLKGGAIRIKLKNGTIALESSQLGSSVQLYVPDRKKPQENSQNQRDPKIPLVKSRTDIPANLDTKKTAAITEKFQSIVCQVTTQGSDENPTWVLEVERGEPVLKGFLKNALLGTMNVREKPCFLEATFHVSARDVCITEVEGLWSSNISKKRSVAIERALVRCFLKRKFQPYLSRVELRYD
ncbi:MAG TPA: hypothetical protein V6D50_13985 [Chroococcales cyanobacterium]|jgi:hypothetical protein